MKISKKEMIVSVALCLLPIVLGIFLWDKLPDKIPTHFGVNGEANGYSSKGFAVIGLPCVMAAIDALTLFFLRSDPKAEGHSKALSRIILWLVPGMSCVLTPMCMFIALGNKINVALYCQLFVGVLFIVVGNYLPKCSPNYTMGIRISWTLNDEDNWRYTHRVGGFVWVIAGFAVLIYSFFGNFWVMLAILIAATIIPIAASYSYHRKHKGE